MDGARWPSKPVGCDPAGALAAPDAAPSGAGPLGPRSGGGSLRRGRPRRPSAAAAGLPRHLLLALALNEKKTSKLQIRSQWETVAALPRMPQPNPWVGNKCTCWFYDATQRQAPVSPAGGGWQGSTQTQRDVPKKAGRGWVGPPPKK